ncbi:exported hypothetical protein [uncultured Thiomicrorhabdus sp.]|jgi:hypothetical protein
MKKLVLSTVFGLFSLSAMNLSACPMSDFDIDQHHAELTQAINYQ